MSRVIRARNDDGARIIEGAVYDAKALSQRIVDSARDESARLIAEAETKCARIREEATLAGEREGRAQAAALLVHAGELRDDALERAEDEVLRLGIAVAQRLVGDELAVNPDRIRSIVQDVVARARRAHHVVIRTHPDDVDRVRTSMKSPTGGASVDVQPDATLTRGGCIVTTEVGEIDARIETQLDAIERALVAARHAKK